MMWLRVFTPTDEEVPPAELAEYLHAQGFAHEPHFKGDTHGWTSGELRIPRGSPILIARYLTKEDDLRDHLNAYAAELETLTYSKNNILLMEKVIQARQLITIRKPVDSPDESLVDRLCESLVKYLAERTSGFYQINGQGWFSADGEMLLQEY